MSWIWNYMDRSPRFKTRWMYQNNLHLRFCKLGPGAPQRENWNRREYRVGGFRGGSLCTTSRVNVILWPWRGRRPLTVADPHANP